MIPDTGDSKVRTECLDIWNAFMVKDAKFILGSDIPICPSTSIIPKGLISYVDAKHHYKTKVNFDPDFHEDTFVHFYIDDQKFDGPNSGIWSKPYEALKILRHFAGVITPDFSTYLDFPDPIKRYNTYRMRALGVWLSNNDIPVINNVRWGTEESWSYCFDGIPYKSVVAIGTVASGLNRLENRPLFETGFYKMIELLNPPTIVVYGSSNYTCFDNASQKGIRIISFPSQTSLAFSRKKGGCQHEQT